MNISEIASTLSEKFNIAPEKLIIATEINDERQIVRVMLNLKVKTKLKLLLMLSVIKVK